MSKPHLDPFFMLRRRELPRNPANVFCGGRRRQDVHDRRAWVHLWVTGVVIMLITTGIVLGIMRTTEAISRAYWPEAAAILEGGK